MNALLKWTLAGVFAVSVFPMTLRAEDKPDADKKDATEQADTAKDEFTVISSDVWTDYPLRNLLSVKTRRGHLVMVDNPAHLAHGDFYRAANGDLNERGDGEKLTYSGIAVLHPDFFRGCSDGIFPLRPLMQRAMAEKLLTSEHYRGEWIDVGTPERLREAERSALAGAG